MDEPMAGLRREYSADVKMTLRVAELNIEIAQMGGGQLWFHRPLQLPAGRGELSLSIDGHMQRWDVRVPEMSEESGSIAVEFVSAAG